MTKERTPQKGPKTEATAPAAGIPAWVPAAARNYLAYTEGGQTIREIARATQSHPSTVLRQVRKVETQRHDPLVDSALKALSVTDPTGGLAGEEALLRDATPVLRRLAEPGAILAVAQDMEKGVVAREGSEGELQRLAIVERLLAEAMALRDWIHCTTPESRVRRYRITTAGRVLLKRLGHEGMPGFAEGPTGFEGPGEDERLRHMRSMLIESPLLGLSRRKGGDGNPFLNREMIAAGERLREDFDLAETAASPPDWDLVMDRCAGLSQMPSAVHDDARVAARLRVERALVDLGPGLAEVALRSCCLLEGFEQIERRLGWSARSAKVVLRIALGRLWQHYRQASLQEESMIR